MDETSRKDPAAGDASSIKVEDKRRFANLPEDEAVAETVAEELPSAVPAAEMEAMRARAEAAEGKLYEYAAAFNQFRTEQEQVRARLERDVVSKVEARFGTLVADLLEAVDDLDRALEHARALPAAEPIVRGLEIARDRFLAMLLKNGVERLDLEGQPFDPNAAEAVALEPVDDPAREGTVVSLLRPGYRLGERIIRPARVTVGRAAS